MTERAWLLMAAMFCLALYGCWQRIADLANRLDMVVIVQQSQQATIDALAGEKK